jgi:hypothetical protein
MAKPTIKVHRRTIIGGLLTLFPSLMVGCGGNSSSSNNTGTTRAVDVFVTDGFDDRFNQVWVTLYKIEASQDSGSSWETLFESSVEGLALNLLSLRDKAQFLGTVDLPEGDFNALRVTFDDTLTVTEPGSDNSQEIVVESHANLVVSDGKAIVTIVSARPFLERGESGCTVEFDVAAFELVGNRVRPHIKPFEGNLLARRLRGELVGTVQDLTATDFNLQRQGRFGRVVRVEMAPDILISGPEGQDATLSNGQKVLVRGVWIPGARYLIADGVRIIPAARPENRQRAFAGTVLEVTDRFDDDDGHDDDSEEGDERDDDSGEFLLELREAGVRPGTAQLTVAVDEGTTFRKAGRGANQQRASFEDINAGTSVVVFGEVNAEFTRVQARRVEIIPNNLRL